jgi:cell wall assembly regulator SMI1
METMRQDITGIWEDIAHWLQAHAPLRAAELMPGASEQAVAILESAIGQPLPEDYAASLRCHDGFVYLSSYLYLDAESALAKWEARADLANDQRQPHDASGTLFAARWWHAAWLPFAADSGGNLLCLDLAPGPKGQRGQILVWEMAMGPGLSGHAGFGAWLAGYRDGLRSGAYKVDSEGFIVER